jgi:hypothetical protein
MARDEPNTVDRPAPEPSGPTGLIFVSHSHEDRVYVDRLAARLTDRGLRPWVDDHIAVGSTWREAIHRALTEASVMILVMTPDAEGSRWVKREVDLAENLGLTIAPLLLRGQVWWWLSDVQYEDVTDGRLPDDDYLDRLAALAR